MPRLELDLVRHALATAQRFGYREVEVGLGEDHFQAKLMGSQPGSAVSPPPQATNSEPDPDHKVIKAPYVGFYRESEPPLNAGDHISQGDVVAQILALGIANDVEAKWSGRISEVLVAPGEPVEFGQPLARMVVEDA